MGEDKVDHFYWDTVYSKQRDGKLTKRKPDERKNDEHKDLLATQYIIK